VSARSLIALLAACACAGCAGFSRIAPGDSEVAVGDKVGAPATVWKNPDGTQLWQYPQGYYATQTFVIVMGPDQRVREVHQVLSEEYFSRVQSGMSRDDVYRLLGRPREVWYFPPRDEEVWIWRYLDTNYMFFNVLFDRTRGTVRTVQRLQEIQFLDGNGRRG
jgi:hypothetical protein